MKFIGRKRELRRLHRLADWEGGGLAVVWGRRRVGKTRLLLEWVRARGGHYWVADESAAAVQRRYLAHGLEALFPGFSQAEYPDWSALLDRLGKEALHSRWRGPLVLDELPYLVVNSPELPSVLQRWLDHSARQAKLCVALAGSSQRMMQGLVLDAKAPLYGRARELMKLRPLPASYLQEALQLGSAASAVKAFSLWGGVPRYWELARPFGESWHEAACDLVLDPMGPLHEEPQRVLLEEKPPAVTLRPLMDAIGMGAHRMSEIAGRVGQPATAISRPLARLTDLEMIERAVPFGSAEKATKRALYRLGDPFLRFWFRAVAPNRGLLATGGRRAQKRILDLVGPRLVEEAWGSLCRAAVPALEVKGMPMWGPAQRFWQGTLPEWDVVAQSPNRDALLLGEAKWHAKTVSAAVVEKQMAGLLAKGRLPGKAIEKLPVHYIVFVRKRPEQRPRLPANAHLMDASDIMGSVLCEDV